jgi:hypothetical protein
MARLLGVSRGFSACMRANASSIDAYLRGVRPASARMDPIHSVMRSWTFVSARAATIAGDGPSPSIATTFATRSGWIPVYERLMAPPSEWPMIVTGARRC